MIYVFFQSEHIVAFLFSLARGLDLRYFIYFRVYCGNSNFFVNVIAPSEPINQLLKILNFMVSSEVTGPPTRARNFPCLELLSPSPLN